MKRDLALLSEEELRETLKRLGQPAFREKQIRAWLKSGAASFEQMTNLPGTLRAALEEEFFLSSVEIEERYVSRIDGTVKYLYRLHDGELIESVLMKYEYGYSICISTQAGCKMGCSFCATGMGGFRRNLTPSEMAGQLLTAQKDRGVRISHIVLMGMGEPLDNYDNVLRFIREITDPEGVNIGMRHISLSTCGLVDGIRRLMAEKLPLTLSISLHAPNDEIRKNLMPIAKKWSIGELLGACRDYTQATKRRISFEYAMIQGVNDSDANARELAGRLKGMLCHVNLIPTNRVAGTAYEKSTRERLERFSEILASRGITATVRRSLGADIEAACGQLRGKRLSGGAEQDGK